jgi:hypothetical protein
VAFRLLRIHVLKAHPEFLVGLGVLALHGTDIVVSDLWNSGMDSGNEVFSIGAGLSAYLCAARAVPERDVVGNCYRYQNRPEARDMLAARLTAKSAAFPKTDLQSRACLAEASKHVVTNTRRFEGQIDCASLRPASVLGSGG